jgi:hypothetical protein
MESRLWEVGGGEHWYSQTTDRDVLFVRDALTSSRTAKTSVDRYEPPLEGLVSLR